MRVGRGFVEILYGAPFLPTPPKQSVFYWLDRIHKSIKSDMERNGFSDYRVVSIEPMDNMVRMEYEGVK